MTEKPARNADRHGRVGSAGRHGRLFSGSSAFVVGTKENSASGSEDIRGPFIPSPSTRHVSAKATPRATGISGQGRPHSVPIRSDYLRDVFSDDLGITHDKRRGAMFCPFVRILEPQTNGALCKSVDSTQRRNAASRSAVLFLIPIYVQSWFLARLPAASPGASTPHLTNYVTGTRITPKHGGGKASGDASRETAETIEA